jgi:hypothetical protein
MIFEVTWKGIIHAGQLKSAVSFLYDLSGGLDDFDFDTALQCMQDTIGNILAILYLVALSVPSVCPAKKNLESSQPHLFQFPISRRGICFATPLPILRTYQSQEPLGLRTNQKSTL